jgi:MFS family permease
MGRLFRHRDATIYLCGQTLSTIGDSSLWLAMGIWVRILTGSNSDAGLTFFFLTAGLTLSPLTGVLVDRVRRRPLAARANLAAGAVVCLLLFVHDRHQVWIIYAVIFVYGIFTALLMSAQTALVPALVPDDLLNEANSLLEMSAQGLRIFTPLIGAGLLAWVGAAPVILLDAGTFVVAAACLQALSLREAAPQRSGTSWRADLTAGLSYAWRSLILRRLVVTAVLALAVIGFLETITFAVVTVGLHRTATFLGVLTAVQAVGAIAGAFVAAPMARRFGEVRAFGAGMLLAGAGCLLLTAANLPLVLIGALAFGASTLWINVAAITLIQRHTAAEMVGRVFAVLLLASTGPQALSIAAGAALIAVVPYQALLVIIAVMMVVCTAYWLRGQHDYEAPAPIAPAAAEPAGAQTSVTQ